MSSGQVDHDRATRVLARDILTTGPYPLPKEGVGSSDWFDVGTI